MLATCRHRLRIVLAGGLLLLGLGSAGPGLAAGKSAVIGLTGDELLLYDGPGGQPKYVLTGEDLGEGTLPVTGQAGKDWLEVEINGQRLWVKSDDVMVAGSRGGALPGDPTTLPMPLKPFSGG